jgi:hypothetical protein
VARVDPPGLAGAQHLERCDGVARDAERAREVATRAHRDHSELGVVPELCAQETGGDLGERAVTAHDHDALDPRAHRLAREPLRVARALRVLDLDRPERFAHARLELAPAPPRGAAAAMRIHDRERAAHRDP